ADCDGSLAFFLQPALHDSVVIGFNFSNNFWRNVWRAFVELLEERCHYFTRAALACALQHKVFAADQFAIAEEEDQGAGFVITACKGDYILVFSSTFGMDNALFLQDILYCLDTVTDAGRLFKVQVLCSFLHLLLQALEHFVVLPLQEKDDLPDY